MSDPMGMTVAEAASRIGCSAGTVYELCAAGMLPHRRVGAKGRQIRITEAHIARYVESCERDSENPPRPDPGPVARRPIAARTGSGRPDGKPLQHIK